MKNKKYYYFGLLLLMLSSCSVYYPQTNAPIMVEHKGDLQVDGGLNIAGFEFTPGVYGSMAYAPLNGFAVQVHANMMMGYTQHIEGSMGFNRSLNNDWLYAGIYGGYSYGHTNLSVATIDYNERVREYVGDYTTLFGRAMLYAKSRNVSLGVQLKMGELRPDITQTDYYYDYHSSTSSNQLSYKLSNEFKAPRMFFEPGVFLQIAQENGFGVAFNYTYSYVEENILEYQRNYRAFPNAYFGNFGISLVYRISKQTKAKQ